ncbi:MAG: hypothetical protein ACRC57_00925 [Sarcina sp.]
MHKAVIGLIVAGVTTFSGTIALETNNINVLNNNQEVKTITSVGSSLNLDQIKFINSKIENTSKGKVINTSIENNSDIEIAKIKYTYDIDGKIVSLTNASDIKKGDTVKMSEVEVPNNIDLNDAKLLRVNATIVENDKLSSIEYIAAI